MRRSSRKVEAPGEALVPAQISYVNDFYPQAVVISQVAALCIIKRRLSLYQKGPRPRPDENASDLIGTYLDMVQDVQGGWTSRSRRWWHQHAAMCRLALDMAKTDPRYLGVRDPLTERSCYKCIQVKPLTDFPTGRYYCLECGGMTDGDL